jgi:hypothetical protein
MFEGNCFETFSNKNVNQADNNGNKRVHDHDNEY